MDGGHARDSPSEVVRDPPRERQESSVMKLRQGRKIPRNLYMQVADEASDYDLDIGRVDSPELAEWLCHVVNQYVEDGGAQAAEEFLRVARSVPI